MSVFKRIRDLFQASVHESLDRLECPEMMLKQHLRNLEHEIVRAEEAISRQVVLEKQQERLIAQTEALIAKRDRQAQLAVDTNEENVAKLALQEKLVQEKKLAVYREQYETLQEQSLQLIEQLKELKAQYIELNQRKTALIARANLARATQRINEAMTTLDTESALKGFARLEERVDLMEARAEATRRIRAADPAATVSLRSEWDDEVQAELDKLRAAKAAK